MRRSASSAFVPPREARTNCARRFGDALDPKRLDGIISMHLIESDPELSGPTTEIPSAASAGAGDWFVLIDGTDVNAVSAALSAGFMHRDPFKSLTISNGIYRLMWDLSKSDIPT